MPCLLPVHRYLAVAEVSEDDGSRCSWCAHSTDPHSLVYAEVLCRAELELLSGAGIAGQHKRLISRFSLVILAAWCVKAIGFSLQHCTYIKITKIVL